MRSPHTVVTSDSQWRILPKNGRSVAGGVQKIAGDQPEPSYTDPHGKTWFPYLAEFRSEDGLFCVEVWAQDDDHAERQLAALRETAALQGRIVAVMG